MVNSTLTGPFLGTPSQIRTLESQGERREKLFKASSRLWEPLRSHVASCSVSRLISHPGKIRSALPDEEQTGTVCKTSASSCFLSLLIGACGQQHASKSLLDVYGLAG